MKNLKIFIFSILIVFSILPVFSFAANTALVPCNNNTQDTVDSQGNPVKAAPCDFNAFMILINKVVKFILFDMAIPISAIMFAYAGFLMVTSGGSSEAKTKAKHIFTNVALGLIIAIAAWLIINVILTTLGYDGSWIGF